MGTLISQNTQYINALAQDTKSGNTEAFVALLGVFSPAISSIARSFSLPETEYDDLCQEGRIALYRAAQNFNDSRASFKTFATKCIKNSMYTWAKKYSDRIRSFDFSDIQDITEQSLSDISVQISEKVASDDVLDRILSSNTALLSEYERKCIGLKIAGSSTKEIAHLFGKDEKSVENTLFRARAKLKKYISV